MACLLFFKEVLFWGLFLKGNTPTLLKAPETKGTWAMQAAKKSNARRHAKRAKALAKRKNGQMLWVSA